MAEVADISPHGLELLARDKAAGALAGYLKLGRRFDLFIEGDETKILAKLNALTVN